MQTQNQTQQFAESEQFVLPLSEDELASIAAGGLAGAIFGGAVGGLGMAASYAVGVGIDNITGHHKRFDFNEATKATLMGITGGAIVGGIGSGPV